MRRSSGSAGEREDTADWVGQVASHAAAAAPGGKSAGAISVSRDGSMAALDARKSIMLVKLSVDGLPVHKSLKHKDANRWVVGTNVCWCHAERHSQLLASTCNAVALVWDEHKTHPIYALREHKRSVNAICWHPMDGTIATCSADSYIHIWDVRTAPRRPTMSFCAWTSGATCIEWCLGDENVLASSHDNEVRLWDRRRGTLSQPTAFIAAHRHSVRSLAWRPGMPKDLLTLGQDGAVKLWDTDEPRRCKVNLENQMPYSVQLASWAPFGDGLVTAGNDGETTLWSLPRDLSGLSWFDETDAVDLNHVVSLNNQRRQQKLRGFAWRSRTPTNPYQLCSLSVTGELRTQSMMDDWTEKCHVENKPSQPVKRHPDSTDAHSGQRTLAARPSNRHVLTQAVDGEMDELEQSAMHAGRLKFERCTESSDWVTTRLRIEARKRMQSLNARTSPSAEVGHVFVDISFPDGYPHDHHVPPEFIFDTSALWGVSDSVASALKMTLEKYVAELAYASMPQPGVAVGKVCMKTCIDRAVQILDGPLGTGKQGEYSDGESDLRANADQRERKGYTPSPVLSAGLFSGPGYFVTFNNGLPFVVAGRQKSLDNSPGEILGTSSPTVLSSPQHSTQSSSQQRRMPTLSGGHVDDSSELVSPTVTHADTSGISAATMKREYRSFLQELGLQDAAKPNLSAIIMGDGAEVDSSGTDYGASSTVARITVAQGSPASLAYRTVRSRTGIDSSGVGRLGAISAWKWNSVKVGDRSYIDMGLAEKYIATLADVDCPPRESCKRNAVIAENNGLVEVAQTWVLVALALGSLLNTSGASESPEQVLRRHHSWSVHPLGQEIVSDILRRYMHAGDLQTVAALSCVLHDAEYEIEAESLQLGRTQKPTRTGQFEMLPPDIRQQCDNFMEQYAMLLRCRGLPLLSAAVRSRRWHPEGVADDVPEVGAASAERSMAGVDKASSRILRCGVCNLPVRGLGNTCRACGHIGHLDCLRGWFSDQGMSSCPVGCGCQCCHHIMI